MISKRWNHKINNPTTNSFQNNYHFKSFNHSPKRYFDSWFSNQKNFESSKRPVWQYIIGLNLVIFVSWQVIPQKEFLYDHFSLSLRTIRLKNYHTILTHSISHQCPWHLLMNMGTMYFFGSFIEIYFKSRTLIHLYLIGAISGGLCILLSDKIKNSYHHTLGASGAICSILAFYIMQFPYNPIYVMFFPMPAFIAGILIVAHSIWAFHGKGGISGAGHLGGFLGGIIYYFLRMKGFFR